jgi:desulfoferrodoxin (superoxide reductase-like protein)
METDVKGSGTVLHMDQPQMSARTCLHTQNRFGLKRNSGNDAQSGFVAGASNHNSMKQSEDAKESRWQWLEQSERCLSETKPLQGRRDTQCWMTHVPVSECQADRRRSVAKSATIEISHSVTPLPCHYKHWLPLATGHRLLAKMDIGSAAVADKTEKSKSTPIETKSDAAASAKETKTDAATTTAPVAAAVARAHSTPVDSLPETLAFAKDVQSIVQVCRYDSCARRCS